jgi:hypothetical protein
VSVLAGNKPWCHDFDIHGAADAHEFCEGHQLCWCRLCEGECLACRSERLLGEPDDGDDDNEEP